MEAMGDAWLPISTRLPGAQREAPSRYPCLPDAIPLAAWASCKLVRELVSKLPTSAARLPVIVLRGAWGRGEALARMEPVVLAVICLDAII
jgi:hypothetical protein